MLWRALLLSLALSVLIAIAATGSAADQDQIDFFETKIRPVLAEKCYGCHSVEAEGRKKLKGGLYLDSKAGVLKGGAEGKVLEPGEPEKSKLIHALRYGNADTAMPPKEKLPPEVIANFEAWVKMGAPDPRVGDKAPKAGSAIVEQAKNHWAFQPVTSPVLPTVKNTAWTRTDIDKFILAKLEAAKIAPGKMADLRTLLRRATIDLTGLPPTSDDVAAFTADQSPSAYTKLIDRLLASPTYGERWGRHWLDVARYADSKGYVLKEDRAYPYAYTYRDWVIKALNDDLPYDRFLQLQIAADRLAPDDKSQLAALGFLTVGRRFINNIHDIIDDRLDVLGRGTMGLSVACARCHDHKFDPIPTKDYYALYGVYASSEEPSDLPVIGAGSDPTQTAAYEEEKVKRQKAVDDFRTTQGADEDKERELRKKLAELDSQHAGAPARAMVLNDRKNPHNVKVFIRGQPGNHGDEAPRGFLSFLAGKDAKAFREGSGRAELARAITAQNNPLTARVLVNRVWAWHFGTGLVRTPSDFGLRTEAPIHRELLDWLAARFIADGYSLKKLHRFIMTSSVYRQSAEVAADANRIDPDNRLWSRANRQRMDLESMRDALLAVSGHLDLTIGGKAVDLATRPFTGRRTVYGSIDRQNLPGVFRSFDFASPDAHTPQRFYTTVPQQALFLMNSPFAVEQAKGLAKRTETVTASEARVQALYRLAFARMPAKDEVKLGVEFVRMIDTLPAGAERVSVWSYGSGRFDAQARTLTAFTPLPRFVNNVWQGGEKVPDPKFGWSLLNADGGHPGGTHDLTVVRRFTAPKDGVYRVSGTLKHPSQNGDGVRGLAIAKQTQVLGDWTAKTSETSTAVERVELKAGQVLDFVLDCQTNENSDSFAWAPVVTLVPDGGMWDAQNGFSGPSKKHQPLNAWERYAQALLMTNEFVFVD